MLIMVCGMLPAPAFAEGEAGQGENVMIDYDSLYTLSVLETYPVEINQSGIFLKAPFAFVDRVILEREGIYDDDKPREGSDSIS